MTRRTLSAVTVALFCTYLVAQPPTEPKPTLTFKGHTDPVYAVSYSPDGKLLATGSFDKTIKLWDAATGKELRTFAGPQGHQNLVLSVAFSPNGDRLASGGADNSAKIWDVPSSKPERELALGGKLTAVIAAADGKSLAAGNSEGKIRIWTAADGKQLSEVTTGGGAVSGLAFFPNGQTILSAGTDRILRYTNVANGQSLGSIGAGAVNGLLLHPSGQPITTDIDGAMRAWPAAVSPSKKVAEVATVISSAVPTSDGNLFALALADKTVKLINTGNGQVAATIPALPSAVEALAWNADSATLAVAAGGKVSLFGSDGKVKGDVTADPKAVRAIAFTSNRTELLTGGDDGKLKSWKLPLDPKKPVEPKSTVVDIAGVRLLATLPNGSIVVAGASKTVKLWDTATGKELRTFGTLPGVPKALAISKDGTLLAVAFGKTVKLWQTADGKELPFPVLPAEANSLSFSTDKTVLLVGTVEKTAWLYQLATGLAAQFYPTASNLVMANFHPNLQAVVTVEEKLISQHPFSFVRGMRDAEQNRGGLAAIPNANSLFTLGAGKTLTRWSVGNLQKESAFEAGQPVAAFAVSRNGQLLAVADGESTIQIYTLNNNQLIGSFKAAAKIHELAFHPNGNSLAARMADRSVAVWNTLFTAGQPLPSEFGSMVQSFPHPATVSSIVYVNEQQLATGSDDGIVRLWKIASDQPRSIAHPNLVDAVAFNKDGTQLATACHDGGVRIFDLTKPNSPIFKDIKAHIAMPLPHPVYAVAWSPDGKLLASGSFDKSIKLWDTASGNLVREIKGYPDAPLEKGKPEPAGHRDQVFCLAFSKDGKQLVSGSSDRTVKLWDTATGNLVRDFPNPNLKSPGPGQPVPSQPGFVQAVRFSTDGLTILSAGTAPRNRGFIGVWNVADGKLKVGTEVPFGPIYSLDLSADGKSVLIGCGPRVRTASEAEAYIVPLPK